MLVKTKPKNDGYFMPGEFEEHEKCFMLWPERQDIWHSGAFPAQKAFAEVANAIAQYEPITMFCSHGQFDRAKKMLSDDVQLIELSYNDAWIRDSGPTFIKNHEQDIRAIDWTFNAWGGLKEGAYFPWDLDDYVAKKVASIENVSYYRTENFVLEGGSIHVDGEGTLITTKQCLLNANRNPHLTQKEIEDYLRNYLNIEKIIWLEEGLFNDETDGHVDNICCFARPGEVVLAYTDDESSPHYSTCQAAYEVLSHAVDAKGRKLKVHKLALPKETISITEEEFSTIQYKEGTTRAKPGEILAASYVNFLIANGAIIMPIFEDENDAEAIAQMKDIFPKRTIVPILGREIILGGGNIHCITQQKPM